MTFRLLLAVFASGIVVAGSAFGQANDLAVRPEDPASPVHPRRFGLPGGLGKTRGWYVWHKFDAKTWIAEVSHEGTGKRYQVRVLPWLTTYRHLVYGAHPDDLLPGERVNLFFNPDDKQQRAYLVHFQDEMCQMKGHNYAWKVETVHADASGFTARVMAGEKPLDEQMARFHLDPKCQVWRAGKTNATADLGPGKRYYMTWVYDGTRRVVKLLADAESLDALQKAARERIDGRIKKEGMTAFVEDVSPRTSRLLVFATWWLQAGEMKTGAVLRLQATDGSLRATGPAIEVRLVSRKNLGTYGSGCSELIVAGAGDKQNEVIKSWVGGKVIRVFAP